MDLNPSTPLTVTLTMGKLYAVIGALGTAAVALLVCFWLIGTWTVGGVRDDVKNIRDDISGLHKSDKDNVARIADVSSKLSDQIQGLRTDFGNLHMDITNLGTQFKYFSERLETVNKSIAGLDNRLDKFDARLASLQNAWTDPKQLNDFLERVKEASGDAQKIVVVPLVPPPQRQNQ